MKKLTLLLTCILYTAINVSAQTQEVVETDMLKNEIWSKAKIWIASTFSSYKYSVDLEDKEVGIIKVRWNTLVKTSSVCQDEGFMSLNRESSITIDVKDNKYRYTIPNAVVTIKINYISSSDISKLGDRSLNAAMSELELMNTTSKNYFNSSLKWEQGEKMILVQKDLDRKIKETPSTLKNGKTNPEHDDLSFYKIRIITPIIEQDAYMTAFIIESLKKGMTANDDF